MHAALFGLLPIPWFIQYEWREIYLHWDAGELRVQGGKRRAGHAADGVLAALLRLVQFDLQVPDVVNDVLQDLHFASLLVCGQSRHELLQFAVAAVHVLEEYAHLLVQQRDLALGDGQTLIGQAAHHVLAFALQGTGRSDNLHLD